MTRASWIGLLLLACASVPPAESPEPPDWASLADEGTIQLVTADPDGEERVTTVWLAVVDDAGFVRTGGTRWFANLTRDPRLRLRAAGREYALRIERVEDPELAARIDAAFRAKYGLQDRIVAWFRGDGANRMRLLER